MCAPPAALIGLQVGGGVFNFLQQSGYARDLAKYQTARAQSVAEATRADAVKQFSTLATRSRQEQRFVEGRLREISREASQARGFAQASAAAGGVEGNALQAVLRDYAFQESVRITAARSESEGTQDQIDLQRQSIASGANQNIFNSIGSPVQTPSVFGTLLQIGTQALGTYYQNSTIDPSTGVRSLNTE